MAKQCYKNARRTCYGGDNEEFFVGNSMSAGVKRGADLDANKCNEEYCDAEQSGKIVAEIIEKVLYSSNHTMWSHELDKCLKVFNCASHESTDIIMTPSKNFPQRDFFFILPLSNNPSNFGQRNISSKPLFGQDA